MSIYQDIILDHYRNPRNFGHLKNPKSKVTVANPLCGDVISFEIIAKDGAIADIAFSGNGCAISLASASMLTEYAKNKKEKELIKLDKAFMIKLLGIELSPNRLKCGLLPWEALIKILS